jgi:putative flavoprotein involved in K+ transport
MTNIPTDALDVVVVGAGQAGLATAYHLKRHGLRFLVVDAAPEIGHRWRTRWDSLRLFTPAFHDGLPGMAFPAAYDAYPTKDEVADYLADYAWHFCLPVLLSCPVTRVTRDGDGFEVHTAQGVLRTRQVVVATGPFQLPAVPPLTHALGASIVQLHSSAYRRPSDLPEGHVVVVGGGNSGRQIALELAATHDVTLAVGRRGLQLPQSLLGRDLFWWLTRLGVLDATVDSRLARRLRSRGDLVIGSPLRDLRRAGVHVRRRLTAADSSRVHFEAGPAVRPAAVVWATGFQPYYAWLDVPGVVDDGRVRHRRGLTDVPGLAFVGLPWQHTRGSSLLGFVGADAEFVAESATAHMIRNKSASREVRIARPSPTMW